MNVYLIYAAFYLSLWSGDPRTGRSVVIACCAIFIVEILLVIGLRTTKRELFSRGAPIE